MRQFSIHRNLAIKINQAKSYEYPRGRERHFAGVECRAVREEPGRMRKLPRTLLSKNRKIVGGIV